MVGPDKKKDVLQLHATTLLEVAKILSNKQPIPVVANLNWHNHTVIMITDFRKGSPNTPKLEERSNHQCLRIRRIFLHGIPKINRHSYCT